MAMGGQVTGHLILVFDDASGLARAVAAALRAERPGRAGGGGAVGQPAARGAANVVGCASLTARARFARQRADLPHEFVPPPPRFLRDFAEALLEAALMTQAVAA